MGRGDLCPFHGINVIGFHSKVTLTVSEAAEMIGISKPSMYEVVRAGKVRSVKVGKKILISRQSLMDWLKKGETYGAEAC